MERFIWVFLSLFIVSFESRLFAVCFSSHVRGAGLLWFGWFGFNAGAGFTATGVASLAVANTQIAAATGFISFLFFDWFVKGKPSAV
jgi:ammonia channel protein AmtB